MLCKSPAHHAADSLDLVAGLVAFLDGEDVGVSGGGAFNDQRILDRIQTGVDGVVGVDDSVVLVLQDVGDLSGIVTVPFC